MLIAVVGNIDHVIHGKFMKKFISHVSMLKSRKENPQKPTQLSSRSHPRHLVGKRTAQKTPS